MKTWYSILKLSPYFVVLAVLTLVAQDVVAMTMMPPEFQFQIAASAVGKLLFGTVGAACAYWLCKLVEQLIPGVKD